MDHPEKLYPIILGLFFLLIVLYLQKIGEQKKGAGPSGYLGTQLHVASMSETIEDVARKVIIANPTLDDKDQVRMVRDELLLRGFKSVDMYESAIYATVSRLKGGAVPPPPPPPAPPPPSQRS
jgi:hypothetical protein